MYYILQIEKAVCLFHLKTVHFIFFFIQTTLYVKLTSKTINNLLDCCKYSLHFKKIVFKKF